MRIDFSEQEAACNVINQLYLGRNESATLQRFRSFSPNEGWPCTGFARSQHVSMGMFAGRIGQTIKVYIAGIEGRTMAIKTAVGYSIPAQIAAAGGFNPMFALDAGVYWANILDRFTGEATRIEIHGHSAGGAIGEIVAIFANARFPRAEISIDTYGAPSPSHQGKCLPSSRVNRKRWTMRGDPVPLVPHVRLSNGNTLILAAISQALGNTTEPGPQPGLFVHPSVGLVPLGHRVEVTNEWGGDLPAQQALQEWMNRQPSQLERHDVTTYATQFTRMRIRFPNGGWDDSESGRPETPAPVQLALVLPFPAPGQHEGTTALAVQSGPDSIALDSAGRTVGSITHEEKAMAFLRIDPKFAFRRVRIGNRWQVTIGERVVMETDEPKTPRTIVKRLNAMLRGIGTDNAVNVDELTAGLADWLNAAAGGNGYSAPPVRIIT